MPGLRELLQDDVPLVAASFGDATDDAVVQGAFAAGLDLAELRVDWFASADPGRVVDVVRRFRAVPTLATIRSAREGGDWKGTEAQRLGLFEAVVPEVDAVDVELSSGGILGGVVAAARAAGRVVVVSHHDFGATPPLEALVDVLDRAKDAGADYAKLSTMARSAADLRTLAAFTLRHADRGLIVIAMGAEGAASRVFFPTLGSRVTYSRLGDRAAPGQLSLDDTVVLLRTFSPAFARRKADIAPLAGDC